MSTLETNAAVIEAPHAEHDHNHHDPNLAHHFDTPKQQAETGKLGMWAFLATEVLMFGGLFCAYSVYRHNHPEVFEYAHQYLNRWLGALNTIVLITSSLTMAWGVRAAQMGNRRLLQTMLVLTLVGAAGFMVVKSIEYTTKFRESIGIGSENLFYRDAAETKNKSKVEDLEKEALHIEKPPAEKEAVVPTTPEPPDPNAGTGDAAKIVPPDITPAGLSPNVGGVVPHEKLSYEQLDKIQKHRVYTFFAIYFIMTGLHGIHVLVGMALIFWILCRASNPAEFRLVFPSGFVGFGALVCVVGLISKLSFLFWVGVFIIVLGAVVGWLMRAWMAKPAPGEGEFGPKYFTPVDLVGLYWHLVDLIWIFLFPLLYLIH